MVSYSAMEKKHIITIAGKPGSGKSTTSKRLATELGYTHFSSGDLFRAIAKERGIDVYEVNILAETEKEIDHQVDQKLRDIGAKDDELVIDSRMAWHWMPQSFKVYLDLDLAIAAERILDNMTAERIQAENIPPDTGAYTEVLQKRLNSEVKRYYDLYQVNPYDTNNYDLVIDTSKNNPDQVTSAVLELYTQWIEN